MFVSISTTSGGNTPETFTDVQTISISSNAAGDPENVMLSQQFSTNKETVVRLNYADITSISVEPDPVEVET